jgi:hypothetical protein
MQYLRIKNGTPEKYSLKQLMSDNPNISFPKDPSNQLLADWNVYPYTQPERPEYNRITQDCVEGNFVEVDGAWILPWSIVDLSPEQIEKNKAEEQEKIDLLKFDNYQNIADPLFFKWQAGEATKEEWLAARDLVKGLYPDVN